MAVIPGMKRVTCDYCGLPFRVRTTADGESTQRHYCCTGCAMLARVPVNEQGQFPVNTQLVSVLAVMFLLFNQVLFWMLSVLLFRQDRPVGAERFLWVSAAVAILVWAAVTFIQYREKAARKRDVLVLVITIAAHGTAIGLGIGQQSPPVAWIMALTNVLLIVWSMRGAWRGLLRGKKR